MSVMQFEMFTGGLAYPPMTDQEKVNAILEQYPGARNDDGELLYRFWMEFDDLGSVLRDEEARERFLAFLKNPHTTSSESIRRRRQDAQKNRTPGAGALLPDKGEAERRRSLDGAGPPRGRR